MDAKQVRWWVTRVLLVLTVLVAIYGFRRFQIIAVPAEYDGLSPSFPTGGGKLMVDHYYTHARKLSRKDILLYQGKLAGETHQLIGRLRAMPGDELGREGTQLTIRGETTAFAADELPNGKIPPGYFLLLNENERSGLPDGRRLGLIPLDQIIGRVIALFPNSGGEPPEPLKSGP